MGTLLGNYYCNGKDRVLIIKDTAFSHVDCKEWGPNRYKVSETTRAKSELDKLHLVCNVLSKTDTP